MLTACEKELVAVHAHGEEGELLVEEQGAVCEHGMGTSAAGCTNTYVTMGLWTMVQEDLGELLRLEQESIDAVVMRVAHKTLRLQ